MLAAYGAHPRSDRGANAGLGPQTDGSPRHTGGGGASTKEH